MRALREARQADQPAYTEGLFAWHCGLLWSTVSEVEGRRPSCPCRCQCVEASGFQARDRLQEGVELLAPHWVAWQSPIGVLGTNHHFATRLIFLVQEMWLLSFTHRSRLTDYVIFFSAPNTEFALATSDAVSRLLSEHNTTQILHSNPHVCRPHLNGTPSLLAEHHIITRNTQTYGVMTRHAPSDPKLAKL